MEVKQWYSGTVSDYIEAANGHAVHYEDDSRATHRLAETEYRVVSRPAVTAAPAAATAESGAEEADGGARRGSAASSASEASAASLVGSPASVVSEVGGQGDKRPREDDDSEIAVGRFLRCRFNVGATGMPKQFLGKPHEYRWHLGCILLKMPAIFVRTGRIVSRSHGPENLPRYRVVYTDGDQEDFDMASATQKSKLEGLLVDNANVKKEELAGLTETERSHLGLTQEESDREVLASGLAGSLTKQQCEAEVSDNPLCKKRRKEGAGEAAAAAVAASPTF